MTETEKHIAELGKIRYERDPDSDSSEAHAFTAAIKALRACEKIRELIEREGREASAAEIEGLLP